MSPSPANDGLRSEALRTALGAALGGRFAALDDLLSRLGRGESPRPNLRLAAAFGAELAAQPAEANAVIRLLSHLGDADAEADKPGVFLPVAAAHGWAALLQSGREQEPAWAALAELAADGRTHVRLGALDALTALATRQTGRQGRPGDTLVSRAVRWLDLEDREVCFGAAAVVVEIFGDARTMSALANPEALLDYLTRAIDVVADAPRAAERSEARRRLLTALPRTLAAVVSTLTADDQGTAWLEAECVRARHPDVREALSNTLARFASRGADHGRVVTDRLRTALQGSAKPPRDPTRRRPGAARGKASRPVR
jgi:hypothetical protein